MCRNNNINSAPRAQHLSLVTHGIADKAAYLSETMKLHLLFSPYHLFLHAIDHSEYITSTLFHIHLQTHFTPPIEWTD